MNFLYFAYGVGLVVAMNIFLFILTLLGHQFIDKQILENMIHVLFFIGLILIGYMITRKAPETKIINALLLALMLVTVMGGFIFISGFVPNGFNLFLLGSFLALIAGCGSFVIVHKKTLNTK